MFDLALQVRLKQARNALRDGRLDEAFTIALEKEVKDHRGGQLLLEELVPPLLDRAARHHAAGHLREALLDVEKAIAAGGARPESVELKRKIEEARAFHEKTTEKEREILSEARRRVLEGSLGSGKLLIEKAGIAGPEASRILREAEGRERRAERAMERADEHLQRGEVFEALRALEEAVRACARHEKLPEVLFRAKGAACERIEKALADGAIDLADDLYGRLRGLAGDSLEIRGFEAPIASARDALEAYAARDFTAAQVALERLSRSIRGAEWVEEARSAVERLVSAQRTIEAGPLGRPWGGGTEKGGLETLVLPRDEAAQAPHRSPVRPTPGERSHPAATDGRMLLWVDGVGTYLILPSSRVTVGRAGASTRPDIALSGDLAGRHGEIVRVEDDYFVVASQGTVRVNGRAFERKLLASGDMVEIGPKCRFGFRVPTPLSATAVLSLHGGTHMEGGARSIILAKEHLILGPKGKSHVETVGPRVILSFEPRGVVCRAEEEVLVQGKPAGREALVPLGMQVEVGGVSFALTDTMGGRV